MKQQNNNNNLPLVKENPSKDAEFLSNQEIEHFKNIPTNIHVVYSKIHNKVLIEKTDTVFTTEDEADRYAETLAVSVSGLSLNFWEYSTSDIAVKYVIEDLEEVCVVHRITIYPKKF